MVRTTGNDIVDASYEKAEDQQLDNAESSKNIDLEIDSNVLESLTKLKEQEEDVVVTEAQEWEQELVVDIYEKNPEKFADDILENLQSDWGWLPYSSMANSPMYWTFVQLGLDLVAEKMLTIVGYNIQDSFDSMGIIDWNIWPKTIEAIKAFQTAVGIESDWYAGPQFFAHLVSLLKWDKSYVDSIKVNGIDNYTYSVVGSDLNKFIEEKPEDIEISELWNKVNYVDDLSELPDEIEKDTQYRIKNYKNTGWDLVFYDNWRFWLLGKEKNLKWSFKLKSVNSDLIMTLDSWENFQEIDLIAKMKPEEELTIKKKIEQLPTSFDNWYLTGWETDDNWKWIKQPILYIDNKEYKYDTPDKYVNALLWIMDHDDKWLLDSTDTLKFITELQWTYWEFGIV